MDHGSKFLRYPVLHCFISKTWLIFNVIIDFVFCRDSETLTQWNGHMDTCTMKWRSWKDVQKCQVMVSIRMSSAVDLVNFIQWKSRLNFFSSFSLTSTKITLSLCLCICVYVYHNRHNVDKLTMLLIHLCKV